MELGRESCTTCPADSLPCSHMYTHKKYDFLFKLLLIGDSGGVKTCLITRFTDNTFPSGWIATIGIDFKIRTIELDGKIIKLQVFDPSGGERFRTILPSYFRGSRGIVIVYDVTDQETFKHVDDWLQLVQQHTKETSVQLLIGNKSDLIAEKAVDYTTAKEYADQMGITFFETSAKDSTNVEQAFMTLTAEIVNKFGPELEPKSVKLSANKSNSSSWGNSCAVF